MTISRNTNLIYLFIALTLVLLIAAPLLMCPASSIGEELPELDWYGYVGDSNDDGGVKADATLDGGIVVVGHTQTDGEFGEGHESLIQDQDTYLVKLDKEGTVLWKKNYGTMLTVDYGTDVAALSDGGYVVVGNTESTENNLNALIIRTDSDGIIKWNHEIGNVEDDTAVAVREMPDGSIMVLGQEDPHGTHSASSTLAHLIKFSAGGDLLSDHEYKGVTGCSMAVTPDGNVVVAGTKAKQIYAFKADKDGKVLREVSYSPMDAGVSEACASISRTSDGGYVIAGSQAGDGAKKAFMIKTDADLKEQWRKSYGSTGGYYETNGLAKAAVQTKDGGYAILVHMYYGDMSAIPKAQVFKTDAGGNIKSTKSFPEDFGRDSESDLVVLKDGALAVAGTERYLSNPEFPYDQNIFVASWGASTAGSTPSNIVITGTDGNNLLLMICGAGVCLAILVILLIAIVLFVVYQRKD